jgi:hypothetical protein
MDAVDHREELISSHTLWFAGQLHDMLEEALVVCLRPHHMIYPFCLLLEPVSFGLEFNLDLEFQAFDDVLAPLVSRE